MSESKSQKANETRPEAPNWLLDNIAEASKNARKIYLLYIGFLAYCALTVVSTTDRQIVLNEPARLPIINVEVALNGFFLLSPLLAIFVFIYFQIYLNKLKRLTDDLRLIMPRLVREGCTRGCSILLTRLKKDLCAKFSALS